MKLKLFIIAYFAVLSSCISISAKEKTIEFILSFNGDRTTIDNHYKTNAQEISRLENVLEVASNNPDIKITDIKIAGYTSPEGTYEDNKRIAGERRQAVANFIKSHSNISSRIFTFDNDYIDWQKLKDEIDSSNHPYKFQALAMLNRPGQLVKYYGNYTRDSRLYNLNRLGNQAIWDYLRAISFPTMNRAVVTIVLDDSNNSTALETLLASTNNATQQPNSIPRVVTIPSTVVNTSPSQTTNASTQANVPATSTPAPVGNMAVPAENNTSTTVLPTPVPTSQLTGNKYIDFEIPSIDHNSDTNIPTQTETPQPSPTAINPPSTTTTTDDNGTIVVTPETLIIRPGKIIIQSGESIIEHEGDYSVDGANAKSVTGVNNTKATKTSQTDNTFTQPTTFMPRGHIKTNLAQWALAQVNAAIDFDFGPHWSFSLPVAYSGWNYFQYDLKFRTLDIKPEFRYWTKRSNSGFYVGAHAGFVLFNYAFKGDYRYTNQDRNMPTIGGGLSLGYRVPISRNGHWAMEFGVSGGVYYVQYSRYVNIPGGVLEDNLNKTYFGLDGASISFIYSFDLRKK